MSNQGTGRLRRERGERDKISIRLEGTDGVEIHHVTLTLSAADAAGMGAEYAVRVWWANAAKKISERATHKDVFLEIDTSAGIFHDETLDLATLTHLDTQERVVRTYLAHVMAVRAQVNREAT